MSHPKPCKLDLGCGFLQHWIVYKRRDAIKKRKEKSKIFQCYLIIKADAIYEDFKLNITLKPILNHNPIPHSSPVLNLILTNLKPLPFVAEMNQKNAIKLYAILNYALVTISL